MKAVRFLSATMLAGALVLPANAGAQSTLAPQAAASEDSSAYDTIVVTGSRILRPNNESTVPITSISAQELQNTGNVSLGDTLNDLPSIRNTYSQQNSTRFIGTAGLNLLDLRGLGISRTLVLVNGRRHISASEGSFVVDTNTIPTDLIDRVDIVTGGTSAVYGSDAIAGVVNFVLKRNFDGIAARAQTGVSSRGDRGEQFLSLTAGQNFAEGRGNIALALEYSNADALYFTDRPEQSGAYSGRTQFQLTDNPALGINGIPDRTLLSGIRSIATSVGGTYIPYSGTNTLACINALGCRASGVPRVFRFQPNGTLTEADYGTADYRPLGSGNQVGGDGNTGRQYGQFSPGLTRYSANLLAHFDMSDGFKPYLEAKYVRVDFVQESSPTFQSGGANTGANLFNFATNSQGVPIAFDNAYLSPQAATLIQSLQPAGSTGFRLQRTNLDFGSRAERGRRETYRVVAGAQGDFNGDWHYDISANYGQFDQSILSVNNRIQQRFRLAIDAIANPAVNGVAGVAAGAPVCRSRLPGQATATPANAADAAALTADIAACVPINVFGSGSPSQAALNYVNANTQYTGRQKQFVASGFITGDLSQLFELPGGPVGFAVGAEYRYENGSYSYGPLVSQARTFLTAIADFAPPTAFEVKEAFGELNVPLLKDVPFFHELSAQGAIRVADYKGSTGTVIAWNAGGTYAPIPDLRLRGNYAVAVRAPDQGDLYATASQNFGSLNDPCDVNFINTGTSTRVANCAAAGIPVGFINSPARAATTSYQQGGNPFLKEETSRSLTIGGVLSPRFTPGLSVSLDYYDIKVTNVISSPTAQQILDNCYDAASISNSFCSVINRDPTTKFFRFPDALIQGGINYAARRARGFEFNAIYAGDIDRYGKVDFNVVGNYNLERNDFPFVTEPNRPDQLLFEVGDPELQFNYSVGFKTGGLRLGYKFRYISKQAVASVGSNPGGGGVEAILPVGGRPAQNPEFTNINWIPSIAYNDFDFNFDVNRRFTIYGGVNNAFDTLPPQGIIGNGSNYAADGIFDNTGRYFYIGVKARM